MPKRGDIVLIPFPFSNLSGQKIRPALILSKGSKTSDIIVVFITSKTKTVGIPVVPTKNNGLKVTSEIICDKIATLDKKIVLGSIGRLEEETLTKVDVVLRKILGL